MAISIGAPAPDVTLYSKTPEKVETFKLSDFKGKKNLVLLFFPAVFTGTCTKEMCTVRDTMSDYDALDAEVIGISGDLPYSQEAWKKELKLNMTLASDFNHEAVKAYGVEYPSFGPGFHGVAKRAAFVIDRGGILRHSEILEVATDLPSFDAIQKTLKDIQ